MLYFAFALEAFPVNSESVQTSSVLSFRETKLVADHIPNNSELTRFLAVTDWAPVPETSELVEFVDIARRRS